MANSSTRLRSRSSSPVVALVMIGNRLMMKATTTTLANPGPNQMITNGAKATLGTVCKKMAYG